MPPPKSAAASAPHARPRGAALGPLLVSLGAAGWGAENLFRHRLKHLQLPALGIVLVEHALQVLFTLPLVVRELPSLRRAPRRALAYVFLSGAVGSALGTVCVTAAFGTRLDPTAIALLLTLQPIVSTACGAALFGERVPRAFVGWAALAILAGAGLVVPAPAGPLEDGGALAGLASASAWSDPRGLLLVGATIACWGFSTAAGRGAMRDLPLRLAAPLRLWAGLATMAALVAARTLAGGPALDLGAFSDPRAVEGLLLLTTVTGVVPLFVYFAGLARTPASLAGYCEMFYTVSATAVAVLWLGTPPVGHQLAAAGVLVFAIAMLNRLDVRDDRSAAGG